MSVKRIHEGCESGNLPNITDWVFNEGSSSAQVGQKIDQIREKEDAAYWSCVSVKELLVVVGAVKAVKRSLAGSPISSIWNPTN